MSAFIILMVPGSALQVAVAREVSASLAAGDRDAGAGVRRWVARLAGGALGVAWSPCLLRDVLAAVLNVDQEWARRGRAGDRGAVDGAVRRARRAPGVPALQARALEHHRRGRRPARVRAPARGGGPRRDRRVPRHRAVVRGGRASCSRRAAGRAPAGGGRASAPRSPPRGGRAGGCAHAPVRAPGGARDRGQARGRRRHRGRVRRGGGGGEGDRLGGRRPGDVPPARDGAAVAGRRGRPPDPAADARSHRGRRRCPWC